MISDSKRREVAAKLRGNPEDTLIPHRVGKHYGMGCHEAADRFWNMCYRIREAGNYDIAFSTTSVLADLIEPSEPKVKCVAEVKVDGERLEELVHDAAVDLTGVDRDALLELADECEDASRAYAGDGHELTSMQFANVASRIREALGVDNA